LETTTFRIPRLIIKETAVWRRKLNLIKASLVWVAWKAKVSEIRIEFLASKSTFGKPQTPEQVKDLDEASDKFAKFVDFQGHRDFGCV